MRCPRCGGKAAPDYLDLKRRRLVIACFRCDWNDAAGDHAWIVKKRTRKAKKKT